MQSTKKYTVITGASSGIGREAARAFAQRGKNLILAARRRDRLEELKTELLTSCPTIDVRVKDIDLTDTKSVFSLYSAVKYFPLETWVNNAGFGSYSSVAGQKPDRVSQLLRLNIEALTLLSTLFVRDYRDSPGAQLINISSAGGYTIVPNAVTYCASKFYVSAFTEGLDRELRAQGAPLRAKVLAPAATRTEFGAVASGNESYDYDAHFPIYHSSREMAGFLLLLYDSDCTVGLVDRETFRFTLSPPLLPYAAKA